MIKDSINNALKSRGINIDLTTPVNPTERYGDSPTASISVSDRIKQALESHGANDPYRAKPVTPKPSLTTADDTYDYLGNLLVTPEEEKKIQKGEQSTKRILALGDALRHLGNIYTTTKGAPAQKYSDVVKSYIDEKKQERALRDASRLRYAALKQKQDSAALDSAYKRANLALGAERLAETKKQNEFMNGYRLDREKRLLESLGVRKDQVEAYMKFRQQQLDIQQQNANTAAFNADTSRLRANDAINTTGTTTTSVVTDSDGNSKEVKVTKEKNKNRTSSGNTMPGATSERTMPGV